MLETLGAHVPLGLVAERQHVLQDRVLVPFWLVAERQQMLEASGLPERAKAHSERMRHNHDNDTAAAHHDAAADNDTAADNDASSLRRQHSQCAHRPVRCP